MQRRKETITHMSAYYHSHKLIEERCVECGTTNNLHVHHKDMNNLNNNMDNLMTLCVRCHTLEHCKIGGRQWLQMPEEE